MSDDRVDVGKLIRDAWNRDEPAGWFEEIYARAKNGEGRVPWAFMQPEPTLMDWINEVKLDGTDKKAIVVGCGLGDDAEALSALGFAVTAFDISPTAIDQCKARFPQTTVDFQVADLLNLPEAWAGNFDFVLEHRTIQALPFKLCEKVIGIIAGLTAPDGQVFVLCHGRDPDEPARGIPWALSSKELAYFEKNGLKQTQFDEYESGVRRFRVVYRRPAINKE
ncbi:MAG: class I SAM-dependent methyltransferase [Aggregatilineales bacterium]